MNMSFNAQSSPLSLLIWDVYPVLYMWHFEKGHGRGRFAVEGTVGSFLFCIC